MSGRFVLECAVARFRQQKSLAEGAIAQISDAHLHESPGTDSNGVAVLMQHVSGNLVSRWTDFLTSDGEKPGRDRDAEFEDAASTRAALLAAWERGWTTLFDALAALTDADLERRVTIRGEPYGVLEAILRQLSHYGYHVGQIVYVARLLAGPSWKSPSIPRGESETFNRATLRRFRPGEAGGATGR